MGNGQTDQQFGNSGVALLLGPPYLSFGVLMHTQRVSFGFLKEDARAVESFVVPPNDHPVSPLRKLVATDLIFHRSLARL